MLIYIILALTFGYSMIVAETSIGRMTGKSPVGAFHSFGKAKWLSFGGWINAIIPILIVPYYSVIGGWVIKYLFEYMTGHAGTVAEDGYFSSFISSGAATEICFLIFVFITLAILVTLPEKKHSIWHETFTEERLTLIRMNIRR